MIWIRIRINYKYPGGSVSGSDLLIIVKKAAFKVIISEGEVFDEKSDNIAEETSSHQLINNILSNSDENIFECDFCEFSTNARYTLRNHKESHHEGRRHYCEKCDFSALYKTSLTRHVRKTHVSDPYSCTECEFSALSSVLLRKHIKSRHATKKSVSIKKDQGNIN